MVINPSPALPRLLHRYLQTLMLQMYMSLCGMKPALATPQITNVDVSKRLQGSSCDQAGEGLGQQGGEG